MSDPSQLASAQRDARVMREAGDLSGATARLADALVLATPVYGDDHPDVLVAAHMLARLHREAGEPAAARRVLEEALAAGQRRFGDDDRLLLAISFDLGSVAEELGNRHEARRNFARVATAGPAVLGPEHWAVRAALDYLGQDGAPVPPGHPYPHGQSPPAAQEVPRPPGSPPPWPPIPQVPTAVPAGPLPADRRGATLADRMTAADRPPANAVDRAPTTLVIRQPATPDRRPAGPAEPAVTPARVVVVRAVADVAADRPGHTSVGRRGRGATVAAVAAAVAAFVAAGLAGVVVLRDGGLLRPGGPVAQTTGTVSVTGAPPADVRVARDGGAVVVTWDDPADGQVPFLVTGAPPGVVPRLLGEVPAGRTQLRLNGLNTSAGYCVNVAAVYAADKLGVAQAVCLGARRTPVKRR